MHFIFFRSFDNRRSKFKHYRAEFPDAFASVSSERLHLCLVFDNDYNVVCFHGHPLLPAITPSQLISMHQAINGTTFTFTLDFHSSLFPSHPFFHATLWSHSRSCFVFLLNLPLSSKIRRNMPKINFQ